MGKEIVFHEAEPCFKVAEQMLEHGNYVVLISREEDLWILNYLYSETCDRNDVVFMEAWEFESKYVEIITDEEESE